MCLWGDLELVGGGNHNGYYAPLLFSELSRFPLPTSSYGGAFPILSLRPQEAADPADRVSLLAGGAPGERESERM